MIIKITIAILALGLLSGFIYEFNAAINRREQWECRRWKAEAATRAVYPLADWQRAQCEAHGLPL